MKKINNQTKKETKTSYLAIALILLLTWLIYFFIEVSYDVSQLERAIIAGISLLFFIYYARKGFSYFSLFALTGMVTFIGLSVAFGSPFQVPSEFADQTVTPFKIDIVLDAWSTFIISILFSLLILYAYGKMKYDDKYSLLLFIVYIVFWVLIAINAKYYDDWKAENYLTVPFLIIIFITHRWFKLSKLSYSLIFLFMILHVTGSHYTYSDVPLGEWMKSFFGLERNHFDRIVHFSFGLLLAYPMREIFKRIGNLKGVWAVWIPIELVLALSAVFELIEWGFLVMFGGDVGIEYLGMQGDIWDAQKDMALAGLGSIITMFVTSVILIYYNPGEFFREFKESWHIKSRKVLGEVALENLIKKKNDR